jgi:hypothetical protein
MKLLTGLLGLVMLGLALPAAGQTSETVFSHKQWEVQVVGFDDGTFGCVAQVVRPRGTFSIWIFQNDTARLQFYSDEWKFDAGNADLEIQIDRRGKWTLTNAELYENSVLFDLPDSRDGVRFMREVAGGKTLFLRDDNGEGVRQFTLAGSSASMRALAECGETIVKEGGGGGGGANRKANPFN